ncbi:hypothetical protein WMO40_12860 [Bacillaceae bacterium CLA-AA-H227]|uniref:Uncharacterized protein n=1 Tax=Robertmurraya yapensis (ex Hitch et al 2024) TaxID=3133160 RepID=A0ACC6SC15_9BACI
MSLIIIDWIQSLSTPFLLIILIGAVWVLLKVKKMVAKLVSLAFALLGVLKIYLML